MCDDGAMSGTEEAGTRKYVRVKYCEEVSWCPMRRSSIGRSGSSASLLSTAGFVSVSFESLSSFDPSNLAALSWLAPPGTAVARRVPFNFHKPASSFFAAGCGSLMAFSLSQSVMERRSTALSTRALSSARLSLIFWPSLVGSAFLIVLPFAPEGFLNLKRLRDIL
jgi:asparagine N-glycosylation enzyme membrane subunit Stt3